MKDSEIIAALKRLETHYDAGLRHIRALLTIESSDLGRLAASDDDVPFARRTKKEAASIVMRENGGTMHTSELLSEMQKRGHPIAGKNAISSMLSREERFMREAGVGMWSLVE